MALLSKLAMDKRKYKPLKILIVMIYTLLHFFSNYLLLTAVSYNGALVLFGSSLTLMALLFFNKGRKFVINLRTDVLLIAIIFPMALLDLLEFLFFGSMLHLGGAIVGIALLGWLYL